MDGDGIKQTTLRVNPEIARALRSTEPLAVAGELTADAIRRALATRATPG